MEALTAETLKENKGKLVLLGILLVGCGAVAYWNLKPEPPPKPPANAPNVQPISTEEEKAFEQQKKRIEQQEKIRPSSGA
jgi:hypothetical protein